MASNESGAQKNSDLMAIFCKYDAYLGAFQTVNTMLLSKLREFLGHLQNWNHQQKAIAGYHTEIQHIFLDLRNITACHDLSKSANGTMKDLHSAISNALKQITGTNHSKTDKPNTIKMACATQNINNVSTEHPEAERSPLSDITNLLDSGVSSPSHLSSDIVVDSHPGRKPLLNSDFQFKSTQPTSSDSLLTSMLIESGVERQKIIWTSKIMLEKKTDQQSAIDLFYDDMFYPSALNDEDLAGWGPTHRICAVLKESMLRYKNDPDLMVIIAHLCHDYDLLIQELHYHQYQSITRALFKDNKINDFRLSTLWYFTKCFLAKAKHLKESERFAVWPFFQDLLEKYC